MNYKAERFDIWQNLCNQLYQPLIRCRIDIEGHIDENYLIKAVTLSLNSIPLMGCCFDDSGWQPRWINKSFSGEDIICLVEADNDADLMISRCLSSSINFSCEPQLKIFIVRKEDSDVLCTIVSHIVCDAAGFKQYLYLLSKLYTNIKNGVSVCQPPFFQRGIKPLFAGITFKEKLHIFCSRFDAYSSSNKNGQCGIEFSDNSSAYLEKRTLTGQSFDKLKRCVKTNNATVNDGFMALFARSFCKNTGTQQIMFPSTIDLRKFIPDSEKYGISNYSSNCMCCLSISPKQTFIATLAQVSAQMQRHKSGNDILKSVMLWDLAVHVFPYPLLKRIYTRIVTHPTVTFTNLGIIDCDLLKFENLVIANAYMTASIKPRPYLQLTVSTYNDCCTVGCNIYGSLHDKLWIDKLFDDIFTEIEEME